MNRGDRHVVASNVRSLFPGYFAMVMATGIVAIGAALEEMRLLAEALYAVAAVTYVVLAVLLLWRLARFRRLLAADITSHAKGFAFLTTVAASNVLGSASGLIHGWWDLAWVPLVAQPRPLAVLRSTPRCSPSCSRARSPASRRASTAPGSC